MSLPWKRKPRPAAGGRAGRKTLLFVCFLSTAALLAVFVAGLYETPSGDVRLILRTASGEPVFRPDLLSPSQTDKLSPWVTVINTGQSGFWIRDAGISWATGGAKRRASFLFPEGKPLRVPPRGGYAKFRVGGVGAALRPGGKAYVSDFFGRDLESNGADVSEIRAAYGLIAEGVSGTGRPR